MLIVFDWDGVIYNSFSAYFNHVKRMAKQLGVDFEDNLGMVLKDLEYEGPVDEGAWRVYLSDIKGGYHQFYERVGIDHAANEVLIAQDYTESMAGLSLIPGMIELVKELKQYVPVCVFTSSYKQTVLDALPDDFSFDEVIGNNEVLVHKPDPEGLYQLMDQFSDDEVIYIGDSASDVITALNAQVPFIGVTWGFNIRDSLIKAAEDYSIKVVDTVENLKKEILRYISRQRP